MGEGIDARPMAFSLRANLWHDFMSNQPAATFTTLANAYPVTLKGSLGRNSPLFKIDSGPRPEH
jgi:hypothetical protein